MGAFTNKKESGETMETGVAILGYGVVGKGVAHAIRHNGPLIESNTGLKLRLIHILDLLDFPDSPDAALITHDARSVLYDENVDVIVETMGGLKAAYEYTREALSNKKHVVTSNKELVAEYGPELLAMAERNNVSYRFDASVGGGIPVIAPINEYLAANHIGEIVGILNGTTNFMLTYMKSQGAPFMDTLAMAQEKGYAEKDPSADIEGTDACRKLAILSSVAWGRFLDWKTIHTEGITDVSSEDVAYAADLGRVIKLIARSRILGDGRVEAFVMPAMLDRNNPLAGVEGVYNAVMVRCDLNGDVMLYGQGAGMLPTGGAIMSDIIGIFGRSGANQTNQRWDREYPLEIAGFDTYAHGFYARINTTNPDELREAVFYEFPDARVLPRYGAEEESPESGGPFAFMVPYCTEGEFSQKLANAVYKAHNSSVGFIARLL